MNANPIPTQIYTIPTPNPIPLHMNPNPESNPDSDSDSSFDSDSGFGIAPGLPSHQQGVVKLEGEPLPSVSSFKYLGSVIDGSGGCGKDVDGRIKVAWSRWRDLSGVIYDKKVPMNRINKLHRTVVRPAMVYGSECWALRKQEEQRLYKTEMKMLRWSQGNTRKDRIEK